MSISAVAAVLAQVQASARSMTLEDCQFTTLYRESTDDGWGVANIALPGWIPQTIADSNVSRTYKEGDSNWPVIWPDPPTGNGGFWLLTNDTSTPYTGWYWHSTLQSVPSSAARYALLETVHVTEALNWHQDGAVASQPAPSMAMSRIPTPVSEVKGLRRPSWRRWFGS